MAENTAHTCTDTDILVVGGGPSGIIAALAAIESGLSVTLVENRGFVGGNLAIGLPILGFLSQKGEPIIAGLPQKFIERLRAVDAAGEHQPCPLHVSITLVDPDAVKATALGMLAEAGVNVLLHTLCTGVLTDRDGREKITAAEHGEQGPPACTELVECTVPPTAHSTSSGQAGLASAKAPLSGIVRGIVTESKGGREEIHAKVVVDCTGDGDVAFRAGVPCEKGDEHGGMQPPTLMFCMSDVDTDRLRMSIRDDPEAFDVDFIPPDYFGRNRRFIVVGLRNLIRKAMEAGLSIPTERTILITGLREGDVWVNMTRVKGTDGTDSRSVSTGEIEAVRQVEDIRRYLVEYVPGFGKAWLSRTAPFLGIRETRRIVGRYVMTRDDILSCRRFDDAVAVGSYPIDVHHPDDNDCTLEWCGDCYDIPYHALVPREVENLLVAGRCISTTHEAMAAIRVMSTCMAMGEAAGRAATLAVRRNVTPSQVDVRELRKELTDHGAFLRG